MQLYPELTLLSLNNCARRNYESSPLAFASEGTAYKRHSYSCLREMTMSAAALSQPEETMAASEIGHRVVLTFLVDISLLHFRCTNITCHACVIFLKHFCHYNLQFIK